MTVTIERRPLELSPGLSTLPPLLQRIYSAREIVDLNDLDRSLAGLLSFQRLLHIDAAAQVLSDAIRANKRLLIVGDFDVDGATSTSVAMESLRWFGAQQVDFLVPNRFEFGYGLSPEIVDHAQSLNPDLIITVDNGISSLAGVARARELGIEVLITDHHLAGDTVPEDCVIVNPNQKGCPFESKGMAGVGVIFYVMLAVREALKQQGWFEEKRIPYPKLASLLDLVALGTVADVVPLDKNNRILVYQGLQRIRAGLTRPGIRALMQVAKREASQLQAADFGFALAPRLNAAGRLDDMSVGIACLLAEEDSVALSLAQQLDTLNHERKSIETQMKQQAFAIVDSLSLSGDKPYGMALYDDSWHQGVVGLVASRVKDQCYRPVIAFAKANDHTLKGSGRSIKGVNIRDALADVNVLHPDLIIGFGGHAMAAGLSIAIDNYSDFSDAFNEVIKNRVDEQLLLSILPSDGELEVSDFTLDVALQLRDAGPWGQCFPEPVFDGVFELVDQRLVGGHHLKMSLKHPESEYTMNAIAFFVDVDRWPNYHCERVRLAYKVDVNSYRGCQSLQLLVEHMEEVQ